jgi:hypothetical protein
MQIIKKQHSPITEIIQSSYVEHFKNTIGDMYEHYRILMKHYIYKNEVMNRTDLSEEDVINIQRDLADGVYDIDIPDFHHFCYVLHEQDFFFEVRGTLFHAPMKRVW